MRLEKCIGSDKRENKQKNKAIISRESVALDGKEEPMLSPFFWLREDDESHLVERLDSQRTEIDHISDSPRDIPSFSDIKDSDDEEPSKRTHTEEECVQNKVANAFDNEMFEWTQRACSPELCVTPVRSQDDNHYGKDDLQEKNCKKSSESLSTSDGEKKKSEGCTDMIKPISKRFKNKMSQKGKSKCNEKGNRSNGKSNRKHPPTTTGETPAVVPSNLSRTAEVSSIRAKFPTDSVSKTQNFSNNIQTRSKRARVDIIGGGDDNLDDARTVSVEENIQNQVNENVQGGLVSLSGEKFQSGRNENLMCTMNGYLTYQRNSTSKRCDDGNAETQVHDGVPMHQNVNEGDDVSFSPSASRRVGSRVTPGFKNASSSSENISDQIQNNVVGESRTQNILELFTSGNENKEFVSGVSGSTKPAGNTLEAIDTDKDESVSRSSKTTNKALSVSKNRILQKCEGIPTQGHCAFCQSSVESEASGVMMHYFNGKLVAANYNEGFNVINSHKNCTEWAPNVYFDNDDAINLEAELLRSRRIKCSCCGIKGAALGCYEKSCRKSFHVPCAKLIPQCRWDTENFVMLCPLHSSSKLPKEISGCQGKSREKQIARGLQIHQAEVGQNDPPGSRLFKNSESSKYVLCCSGLSKEEKGVVSKFKKIAGVALAKNFGPNVTHIISAIDENGACKRTFKFLMGIQEGRWILKIDWVKACMNSLVFVPEEQFEINVDIHGFRDGPRLGRLRLLNKQPKIFYGLQFYFSGEFTPSYKGYLQDLVVAAGGNVLHRKPISGDRSNFIIYNFQPPECGNGKEIVHCGKYDDIKALANTTGAEVASHSWVLDCIAACKFFPDKSNL
ncbi:hypothetical protein Scep_027565 [Stephania cephalantha]|uniref:Uncharacterized protein n=1 Tax=Stephania cephalantha TaxID=152367 RepID=A0AAP0HHC9_9MAGN